MPKLGTRKVYLLLIDTIRELSLRIGRDKLFKILRENDMLIRRRRKSIKTTNSNHQFRKYKNLIKDDETKKNNQVLVSDLTYIRVNEKFMYLTLVSDYRSRKIIGYNLSDDMTVRSSIESLKMAIGNLKRNSGVIHHSDRGIQYCSLDYTNLLNKYNIKISMTEENHAYENATAERINGILKGEFSLDSVFTSRRDATMAVDNAIHIYNNLRPHMSLNYKTPSEIYNNVNFF
jgi:transposase InsO family protein